LLPLTKKPVPVFQLGRGEPGATTDVPRVRSPHFTCSARRFTVPTHGSPKTALLAKSEHEPFPRHAFDATAAEVDARQEPSEKDPQVPLGVP
jgi:hypothetical protein